METKLAKLLPPAKITPSEWERIAKFLEGVVARQTFTHDNGDLEDLKEWRVCKEVRFQDGFALIDSWNPDKRPTWKQGIGWEFSPVQESTVSIRDLNVDPEFLKKCLLDTESKDKYIVSDAIRATQDIFIQSSLNR